MYPVLRVALQREPNEEGEEETTKTRTQTNGKRTTTMRAAAAAAAPTWQRPVKLQALRTAFSCYNSTQAKGKAAPQCCRLQLGQVSKAQLDFICVFANAFR